MKIAVMNFSGNVGKSTIAQHLLLPRMADAELITVESINSDDSGQEPMRGKISRKCRTPCCCSIVQSSMSASRTLSLS